MATMQLVVNIQSTYDGKGFTASVAGVKNLSGGIAAANAQAGSLVGTIGKLGAAIGITAAAWKGFDILKGMITQGIQFNATLENSRLGMGALISAMTDITSSTRGALEGTEKLNAAMMIAGGIQQELQVMALKTGASYEQMVGAMGTALGPALTAKMDLAKGEIQKFVLAVTQMAFAVDERLVTNGQLNQEIRGILEGDTSKNSRLGSILYGGIKDAGAFVKSLQEQGKWTEWIMGKLKAYGIAGERAAKTFSGAFSNLKDAIGQALGAGTQGQFGKMTQMLLDLTAKIVTFDDQNKATFNPEFVASVGRITAAFVDMASAIGALTSKLPALLSYMAELAKPDAWKTVGAISGAVLGAQVGHPIAGAAIGYGLSSIKIGDQGVSGANAGPEADYASRLRNFNEYLKTLDVAARTNAVSWLKSLPKGDGLSMFASRFWEKSAAAEKLIVTPPPTGPKEPDAKAIRLKNAVDDLTASTEVFLAVQAKLANAAGYESLLAREDAAIKALDTTRAISAAQLRTELASTNDPIRELQIERRGALKAMDDDIAKFMAEQSKRRLEINAGLQALDDELSKFRAGQDKQLQDLMQRGLAFGTTNYKQVIADQATQLAAFTNTQGVLRENLNVKLMALGTELTDFEKVQAAERIAISTESDEKIAEEAFDQLTARVDREREAQEEILRMTRSFTQRMQDLYRDMANEITRSIKSGITALMEGGSVEDAFEGMVTFLHDAIAESFAGLFESFFAKMAAHAAGQPAPGEIGPPSPKTTRNAQMGMLGIQAGAAAYGLYTNPAPKQGQNMLSGAMAGAGIGFQYGAMAGGITAVYGAIVGAIIGAIAGAFAPTEQGKNVRITGTAGNIKITGLDSGAEWGTAKLRLEMNRAIRSTSAKLDAIFLGLPTAALEAMANWRPDLSKLNVTGKADGKNWNEELDNFLKETLPRRVFDAYGGSITAALKFAGVTDDKLKELEAYLRTLKTDEAIQAVSDYVGVIYGFAQIMEMFGVEMGTKTGGRSRASRSGSGPADWSAGDTFAANVYKRADRGPLEGFGDIQKRMGAFSGGTEGMTHEELVARGQQILALSQDFFGGIEEYLLKLRDMQRSMTEGIQRQKRDIALDQVTDPKQRIEFLLAEQRSLYDQLGKATTAEEVNRLIARMQENAGSLYDMMGRTPEAAAQIQSMLDEMQKLADARYALFADDAKKMLDEAFKMVDDILKRLQKGLDDTFAGKDREGPGTGGPGSDPNDPEGPTGPFNPTDLVELTTAAAATAAEFNTGLAPSIAMATSNVVSFAAALERATAAANANVNVQLGDIKVDVMVSENASLIGEVTARATQGASKKVFSTLEQQNRRRAMTGR